MTPLTLALRFSQISLTIYTKKMKKIQSDFQPLQ